MITFKDLPNTETPVTAENLNSNFSELDNITKTKLDINPAVYNLENISTLKSLVETVYANRDKMCTGFIGDLSDTGLRGCLGNPELGNYVGCVVEHIQGNETEGQLRVTAYGAYTKYAAIQYVNYWTYNNNLVVEGTNWKLMCEPHSLNNPDIDSKFFRMYDGVYGIYNCSKAPNTNIGVLEVLSYTPDWVLQRFSTISSGGGNDMWERTFYDGTTWGSWVKRW